MFVAIGLFMLFIFALPFSFLIGALLGYIAWVRKIKNNRPEKKSRYLIVGGVSYILAQPLSLFMIVILPIRKVDALLEYSIPIEGFSRLEMLFAILFAITFTVVIANMMASVD